MEPEDTRAAIGESVRRAIQDSGKSVDEVARLFGVKRQTVYQWQGGRIPMSRLAPLAEKIGQPIVIRIGEDNKATWPEWARQLDAKIEALLSTMGGERLTDAAHEALERAAPLTPDEDPPLPSSPRSDER